MAQFVKTKGDAWIGVITTTGGVADIDWLYAPDDDPEPPNWNWRPELDLSDLEPLTTDPKEAAYRIWAEVAAFGGWVNTAAMQDHGLADELPPPGKVGPSTSST